MERCGYKYADPLCWEPRDTRFVPTWLCVKWHSAWLCGVHRTRPDGSSFTWHQPCQRCKYTTSVDIKKATTTNKRNKTKQQQQQQQQNALYMKASQSCGITCERSDSARERRIALCKSDQQSLEYTTTLYCPCREIHSAEVNTRHKVSHMLKVII